MEVSWIDQREVTRLAETLVVPRKPYTGATSRPTPRPSAVPVYNESAAASPGESQASAADLAVGVAKLPQAEEPATPEPSALPPAAPVPTLNLATFRERLKAIRNRAIEAGLLVPQTPPPSPEDDVPSEPIELAVVEQLPVVIAQPEPPTPPVVNQNFQSASFEQVPVIMAELPPPPQPVMEQAPVIQEEAAYYQPPQVPMEESSSTTMSMPPPQGMTETWTPSPAPVAEPWAPAAPAQTWSPAPVFNDSWTQAPPVNQSWAPVQADETWTPSPPATESWTQPAPAEPWTPMAVDAPPVNPPESFDLPLPPSAAAPLQPGPEGLNPSEVPSGSVGERLDFFASWTKSLLGECELLLVDEYGGLLWGPQTKSGLVLSTMMAWNAAIRASAMSACSRPDTIVQTLANGASLTVIPAETRLGMIQIALVRPSAPLDSEVALMRQTLNAVMDV